MNPIAPWLVVAKASPPRLLVKSFRRGRLLARLAKAPANGVLLLEAPAGYGKTFLLNQWRERLQASATLVAWLSLDETDRPDILVPYLAYAVHLAGIDTAGAGLLSPTFHGLEATFTLGRLLRCIEESGKQVVLILDDVERTPAESVTTVLNPLLRLQPQNLGICIGCRSNPGIRLAGLGVRGGVSHLKFSDMQFTPDEVRHWFDFKLHEGDLDAVMTWTQGWPVALQLFRSTAADHRSQFNRSVSPLAVKRHAADYLREQLLIAVPEQGIEFLRDVSILEHIRPDCADFLLQSTGSATVMHRLHAQLEGLFMPLEQGNAFLLHPLIREHLRDELRDQFHDRFVALNRRAANWLSANNQHLRAMRHALDSGEPEFAAAIFEKMGGAQLWLREGMSRLRAALEMLAPYSLDRFPRTLVARSLAAAKDGDMIAARTALARAKEVSRGFRFDRSDGDDTALLIDGHFIELLLTEYGCAPTADALSDEAWQFILQNTRGDPALYAYIRTWQCLVHMQSGMFDAGFEYGQGALEAFHHGLSRYGELFIYLHFGMARVALGDARRALDDYLKADRISRTEFPGDTGVRKICHIALGELFWETGDTVNARKYLREIVTDVRQQETWFDLYMAAYQNIAEFLLAERGAEAALNYLQEAHRLAINQGLERLETFLVAFQLSLLHVAGLEPQAAQYAARHPDVLDPAQVPAPHLTWRELEALTLSRICAARIAGRHDLARIQIQRLLDAATETGNVRLKIQALIQQALLLARAGEDRTAVVLLRDAVMLAQPGCWLRPFLRESSALQPLLAALRDTVEADLDAGSPSARASPSDFLKRLLSWTAAGSRHDGLSTREIEILKELAKGSSDKIIARTVGLSAHGVRYHLKNIYGKLGVSNRAQALTRVRDIGLVT